MGLVAHEGRWEGPLIGTRRMGTHVVRACVVALSSAALGGCATHYIAHTGTPGSAFVTRGNDLLHCNVVHEVPRCWTVVNRQGAGAVGP